MLPELNDYMINVLQLATHNIYLTDWVICLCSSIMPIDLHIDFVSVFFKEGWHYFYKMCIAILTVLQPYIMGCDQIDIILSVLKFKEIQIKKKGGEISFDDDKTLYEIAIQRRESMTIHKI